MCERYVEGVEGRKESGSEKLVGKILEDKGQVERWLKRLDGKRNREQEGGAVVNR